MCEVRRRLTWPYDDRGGLVVHGDGPVVGGHAAAARQTGRSSLLRRLLLRLLLGLVLLLLLEMCDGGGGVVMVVLLLLLLHVVVLLLLLLVLVVSGHGHVDSSFLVSHSVRIWPTWYFCQRIFSSFPIPLSRIQVSVISS